MTIRQYWSKRTAVGIVVYSFYQPKSRRLFAGLGDRSDNGCHIFMTQKKMDHSIYGQLKGEFFDYKNEICADVIGDEAFWRLSEKHREKTQKIILRILNPRPGRRIKIPEEVESIFRKYIGD